MKNPWKLEWLKFWLQVAVIGGALFMLKPCLEWGYHWFIGPGH